MKSKILRIFWLKIFTSFSQVAILYLLKNYYFPMGPRVLKADTVEELISRIVFWQTFGINYFKKCKTKVSKFYVLVMSKVLRRPQLLKAFLKRLRTVADCHENITQHR